MTVKYKRKPRPIVCALFWIFATFSAISGTAWYFTLTGKMSIAINVQQPVLQQASADQDFASLLAEADKEVELKR